MHTVPRVACVAALLALGACAHVATPTRFIRASDAPSRASRGDEVRTDPAARRRGVSALVIDETKLRSESGSLLGVLQRRVSGMRVQSSGGCPEISLRGGIGVSGSNPGIYVDGTKAVNTCILDGINARDVERVEVYRMGVSSYAGYRTNSNGLIVVFTRRSDD
jgi:hypothetical protein